MVRNFAGPRLLPATVFARELELSKRLIEAALSVVGSVAAGRIAVTVKEKRDPAKPRDPGTVVELCELIKQRGETAPACGPC